MDGTLGIKPARSVTPLTARPDSVLAAIATELAPAESVPASADGAAAGHDPGRDTHLPQPTAREVVIDPQTREVMYRMMSAPVGLVVGQEPQEAMLKLRAYKRPKAAKRQDDRDALEKSV